MHGTLSQEYSVDYAHLYLLPHVSAAQLLSVDVELLSASGIPALAVDAGGKKVRDQAYRALKAAGIKNAGAIVQAGAGAVAWLEREVDAWIQERIASAHTAEVR